jgi:superfamily I DNA/RNA helicase/RecB family exonuclease
VAERTREAVPAELDDHQRAAVLHGEGPALVRAGPGSGKTRVIVERAVRLIDEGAARPEELLVLTFSRKAASELRQRIAARLSRSHASFPVTTFHAFCLALLARHAEAPPRLARPAERRALARLALEEHDDLGYPPSAALTEEALAFAQLCDDYLEPIDHPLASIRSRYVQLLGARGALDYGGLQREAVRLLRSDVGLRDAYRRAFRFILVDEYQDTNVAQDELLRLVAEPANNVFCVADEDQSIYGFRGAEIENALSFETRWGGAVYQLPLNYRSAPKVVALAASVVRRNLRTHRPKALRAAFDRPAELRGRTFRHAAEEADWIAREIARLRLEGLPLGEICVLARSLREIGPRLAYALRRRGLPFHAPLDAPLHPTAEALLSLIELAHTYPWEPVHDDRALRVLASPLFGADPLELRRFRREPRTLYGALRGAGAFEPFFAALALVKRQRAAGAAVYALWERLPYFRELEARCRPAGAAREDVDELAAVTALSDAANAFEGSLEDFPAAHRSGQLATEEWLPAEPLPRGAVALLTVHQAKGLEWEAVFVCDLVEGRFPALARDQHALFDRDDFARRALDPAERASRALEEERRLFYVAISRTRTRLTLTATEEAHEEAGRALSRFYLEAEDHLEAAPETEGPVSADEALALLRRAGGGPPGWRDRPVTVNGRPLVEPERLWLSPSRLAPYEECPLRFFYGSLLELARLQTPEMALGAIFHEVLEAFLDPERGEPQTLDRLLELAAERWREGEIGPAPLAAESRRVLEQMLEKMFRFELGRGLAPEVLAVERRFRFDLGGTTISGVIDRVDRRPDGRLRLVDYKTARHPMSQKEAQEDLQLGLYALAARAVAELASLGEVAELTYLFPRPEKDVVRREQVVAPGHADATRERVRRLVAEIAAEHFDPSPDADCLFCEFKSLCSRWHGGDAPL